MKLTETQSYWLERLTKRPDKRLRYGAPGMPEKTADALINLGLIRREWQPIFKKVTRENYSTFYVVPVEPELTASVPDGG